MSEAADSRARKRLLGATAIMASGTMVSRILGFVRTLLVAFALGNTTTQGDTFTLATVVPNNLYMIFAGGALNTVLVPQIVRHAKSDADGGESFVNRVMTAFLLALALVTVLACMFTPQVMSLWMGDVWHTERLEAHAQALFFLAYLTMPQVFFYGAFFLIGQVLNAHDRFGPMMWAPIVNNVVQIGVLGAYAAIWAGQADHSAPFTHEQVLVLGIGSTVGIVAQTLALIPAMRRLGFRYRPRFDLRGAGLGETFHLAKWAIGYVLVTQLASVVITRLASTATVVDPTKTGPGLLVYNEAYLTWILPHSLLTVSLATALLPSASRLAAAGDLTGVGEETARTLRLANTFIVPAAVGLVVLSSPYANLIFGNGAGASDWHAVGLTLACFAVGLVPYTIQYVYLRGFYALEDMRKAFLLQLPISAANAVLALAWVALDPDPMTVAPRLALCYSLSYLLGAFITHRSLARRLPGLDARGMLRHALLALAAVLPGAAMAWAITWYAAPRGKLWVAAGFVVALVLYGVLYVPLARRLGIAEVGEIVAPLARRLGLRRGGPGPGTGVSPGSSDTDEARVVESEIGALGGQNGSDAREADRATAGPASGEDAGTLLSYPAPDATAPTASLNTDVVREGDRLDGRYRLRRLLARRGRTLTWLADDESLSRPVLVHVLPPGEPRTLEILDAAREAALVTDSRFLRVLDASLAEDAPCGAYVICEYSPGESLELVLRHGPLSQSEACWLVREIADGLVAMHAAGRFHRHLSPRTVVVTASGNVKVVGFLLDAALAAAQLGGAPAEDARAGEREDVLALGGLLQACLLGTGRDAAGQVRPSTAGLSPEVAEVIEAIGGPAASGRPSLETATDVSIALGGILGGTDASRDLDRRVRAASTAPATGLLPRRAASVADTQRIAADEQTGAVHTMSFFPFGDEPRSPLTPNEARTIPFTPVPPPAIRRVDPAPDAVTVATRPETGRWIKVLAGLFALALLIGVGGVVFNHFSGSRAASAHQELAIVGVRDFDPKADGGDDRENPEQASLATDGQDATAWKTERYGKSALFNGRKPGVGLLLDLGAVKTVSSVTVTLITGSTDVELRVPKDAATAPSMATQADWTVVASAPGSTGVTTLTPASPVQTRYLLVYVTKLPELSPGGGYQAGIAEVRVLS